MLDNLLVIIVIYNKPLSEVRALKSAQLLENGPEFLIYDNSLKPQESNIEDLKVTYCHNPNNPGVSTAYNFGFKYAINVGKSIVLILDQDTDFNFDILSRYFDKYKEYGDDYIYAPVICDEQKTKIYSPSMLNNFIGKTMPYNKLESVSKVSLQNKSLINSGLLIPVSLFARIGGYNENIRLDFSDIYFIEKYKDINEYIILVNSEFSHQLSGDEGFNYNMEISRFRFYCNGARELSRSINKSTLLSVTRRMLRLSFKYVSLSPMIVFVKYYLLGRKI